jgi:D-alanyl-D-alanine carboxypeptidase/D-alanyl-D-alanine-endopeptidase (penicillin-binding protein 4)
MKERMKKSSLAFCLVLGFFAFWAPPFVAAETSSKNAAENNFRNQIQKIMDHPCLKKTHYGIKFYSLDRREVLFAHNNNQKLIPASNMKLVTTAVALKTLGPDYRFLTQLYTEGKLQDQTLKGDLYLKGYGDPKLVSEQMWLFVNEVRNLPLVKIEGDLVADDSFFDRQWRAKTWKRKFGAEPFTAPAGALSFNFNTVTVYAKPGSQAGAKPVVVVDPGNDFINVDNGGTTTGKRTRKNPSNLMISRLDKGDYDEILVRGGIAVTDTRSRYFLNITEPTKYTANVFKEFLQREGVTVTGQVRFGSVPPAAHHLLTHESEPLSSILKGLNKYSNNFIAEQLLKAVGTIEYGAPGTTENGSLAARNFLVSLGFPPDTFEIADGSGLSRDSRLTPDQLVKILEWAYSDWRVYPEFLASLGVMGVDGSVRNRMKESSEGPRARVKTGTLNFTSAISGYLQSRDGEHLAFSILMNDFKCGHHAAVEIQDKMIDQALKLNRAKD